MLLPGRLGISGVYHKTYVQNMESQQKRMCYVTHNEVCYLLEGTSRLILNLEGVYVLYNNA